MEAALIVPLLVFVTFGMLEFGLYWQQDHTYNDAARASARLGATTAREPGYQIAMVETIGRVAESLPENTIDRVTIYKADPETGDPLTGNVESCVVDCWRYQWNVATQQFDEVVGPEWAPLDMSACGGQDDTDYIGVWIHGNYHSLTGMIGDREVVETTVLRLEPVPLSVTCAP